MSWGRCVPPLAIVVEQSWTSRKIIGMSAESGGEKRSSKTIEGEARFLPD